MAESPVLQNLASQQTVPGVKLRSSCDGCGDAKVKCDRQQPHCRRCVDLNLPCTYSVSRSAGKAPRKRLANATTTTEGPLSKRRRTPPTNPSQPTNTDNPPPPFSDSLFPFDLSLDFPIFDWTPQLPPSPLNPPSNSTTSSLCREEHSCPRESYEIFRDLICPDPTLHAPESNAVTVTARFDQVLQFNKSAVERLSELLECECAKSGHRALVHASIVSRVLIWYQQAAGWTGGGLGRVTGFRVEGVPVRVGSFGVEDAGIWEGVRDRVVLSELRRTGELVDKFAGADEEGVVGGLYAQLGGWLKGELERTVRGLKGRLGEETS